MPSLLTAVRAAAKPTAHTLFLCLPSLAASYLPRRSPKLPAGNSVKIIPTCRILTSVSARYLSFNVDAAQVVGGLFWNESGKVDGS
ncbi:MAG: hypothetical protein EHM41_20850, partial [Chloroflexi bacterium]